MNATGISRRHRCEFSIACLASIRNLPGDQPRHRLPRIPLPHLPARICFVPTTNTPVRHRTPCVRPHAMTPATSRAESAFRVDSVLPTRMVNQPRGQVTRLSASPAGGAGLRS